MREDVGIRIQRYQKHSSICFIAWHKEQIAGYTWLNKKVFECLIAAYYKKMQQQGYRFVWNLVDVHNPPAIRARERFKAKRKRIYVILLPFNLHITIGKPIGEGKLILQ